MNDVIYRRNISALQQNNSELVLWIEKGARPEGVNLVQGEDGSEDFLIRSASGSRISYYGNGSSIETEILSTKGMDLSRGSMTCLIGSGLGYTVGAILRAMEPGHHVLLVELDPWILRQALSRMDISQAVLDGALQVLPPSRIEIEDLFIRLINTGTLHGNLKIVSDPRSAAISLEYDLWVKKVHEAYQYALFLIENETAVQKVSIEHEIQNTLPVALCPNIGTLKPYVCGKPVLIVGAGPSLDQSIDLILRTRDRVFVLAFAAAWRNLLSHGITPDFVLTSDKNVESLGMLRYTKFAQETPLLFSSSALPEFIRKFAGPRYVAPQSGLYPLPPSHVNHGFSLHTGSSVAVFALNLVIHLEAKPVLFIGLDLAIGPGEETHASGHHLKRSLDPNSPYLLEVEGVHGSTVRTLTHLQNIRRQIECCISSSGVAPINATVSGARILGTIERNLEEVIAELPALVRSIPSPPPLTPSVMRERSPGEVMGRLAEEVLHLKDISSRQTGSLALLKKGHAKGCPDLKVAERTNRSGKDIQDFLASHPLLNRYFSNLWLALKQETQKTLSIQDPHKRISEQIDKNFRFVNQLSAGSKRFLELVEKAMKELSGMERLGDEGGKGDSDVLRVLMDYGFLREACEMGEGTGSREGLVKAEALARKGLLSEALDAIRKIQSETRAVKAGEALLRRLLHERETLVKEAEEVVQNGSAVDARLLLMEVERSLCGDPVVDQIRSRLSEKL